MVQIGARAVGCRTNRAPCRARLRKTELDPAFGNANVRNRRELEAAAERVTGQRRDQGHAQARERFESAVSARVQSRHISSAGSPPQAAMSPPAQKALPSPERMATRASREASSTARRQRQRVDHLRSSALSLSGRRFIDPSDGPSKETWMRLRSDTGPSKRFAGPGGVRGRSARDETAPQSIVFRPSGAALSGNFASRGRPVRDRRPGPSRSRHAFAANRMTQRSVI